MTIVPDADGPRSNPSMKTILAYVLAAFTLAACGDESPTVSEPAPHARVIYTRPQPSGANAMEIISVLSDGSDPRTLVAEGKLVGPPTAGHILYLGPGNLDLYMAGIDGLAPARIRSAFDPDFLQSASISPDGGYVASVGWVGGVTQSELTIQKSDGTDSRVLATDLAQRSRASFSPDGRKLAFFATDNSVCIINIDGTGRLRMTAPPSTAEFQRAGEMIGWSPEWSPSGEWLAVESISSEMIEIIRVDGRAPYSLRSFRGAYPHWSPDGTEISCTDNEWIVVHPIDGTSRGISDYWELDALTDAFWSPHGDRLLSKAGQPRYYSQLFSVDIARREQTLVAPNVMNAYWLP